MGDWKHLASLTVPPPKPYGDIRAEDQKNLKLAELDTFELYHLSQDIAEITELSAKEPKRFASMKAQMQKLFREVRDESPSWPAWKSPGFEGDRIRVYRKALIEAEKEKPTQDKL